MGGINYTNKGEMFRALKKMETGQVHGWISWLTNLKRQEI